MSDAQGSLTMMRPARPGDVPALAALIASFARQGLMLERSAGDLYDHIRDFLVVPEAGGGLAGCVALRFHDARTAELRSLAVAAVRQGCGLGRSLVEGCLAEARRWQVQRLICLTAQEAFFSRVGFVRVDRSRFPLKVWNDCVRCADFLHCREVAMERRVPDAPGPGGPA